VHQVDVRICQQNASVVSNIFKAAYSCKNVVQRGKKRKIFKTIFQQKEQPKVEKAKEALDFQLKVKKIRLVCFDNLVVVQPR
jgi:hypothetical protein